MFLYLILSKASILQGTKRKNDTSTSNDKITNNPSFDNFLPLNSNVSLSDQEYDSSKNNELLENENKRFKLTLNDSIIVAHNICAPKEQIEEFCNDLISQKINLDQFEQQYLDQLKEKDKVDNKKLFTKNIQENSELALNQEIINEESSSSNYLDVEMTSCNDFFKSYLSAIPQTILTDYKNQVKEELRIIYLRFLILKTRNSILNFLII